MTIWYEVSMDVDSTVNHLIHWVHEVLVGDDFVNLELEI